MNTNSSNEMLHRAIKLATELHGRKEWYHHGELHRGDDPAIEYENGSEKWYRADKLHREDGPAVIIYYNSNESKIKCEWWKNGVCQKIKVHTSNVIKKHDSYGDTVYEPFSELKERILKEII